MCCPYARIRIWKVNTFQWATNLLIIAALDNTAFFKVHLQIPVSKADFTVKYNDFCSEDSSTYQKTITNTFTSVISGLLPFQIPYVELSVEDYSNSHDAVGSTPPPPSLTSGDTWYKWYSEITPDQNEVAKVKKMYKAYLKQRLQTDVIHGITVQIIKYVCHAGITVQIIKYVCHAHKDCTIKQNEKLIYFIVWL